MNDEKFEKFSTKILGIFVCFTYLLIAVCVLFIFGISRVDAREDYSVSACWFGSEKKSCNTGFDISNMQGKSIAIDINKVASGTLSFHASLTMNLWNWQSGDTVNVSGAYAFGNASYTCDSSNGCYMQCHTNGNWVNCEMWIDTFHSNNDEKITAVFYLNGNTFNRTFLANANGSAWVDSSTGNLTNGGFNSSMNNQTNSIIGNQDKNKDEIIDNQNKNQAETNEKFDEAEETRKGILETIINLPKELLNMLIRLIVPDNFDFLNGFLDSLENKLGFIGSVPIQMIDFLIGLVKVPFEEMTSITMPSFSVLGYDLWSDVEIDLSDLIETLKPYRIYTNIGCVCLVIRYLTKLYDNFANGGNN